MIKAVLTLQQLDSQKNTVLHSNTAGWVNALQH